VKLFNVSSIPDPMWHINMVKAPLGKPFMIIHNLASSSTLVAASDSCVIKDMQNAVLGMEFSEPGGIVEPDNPMIITFFSLHGKMQILEGIYAALRGCDVRVIVSFMPAERAYVENMRKRLESAMSTESTRFTRSLKGRFGYEQAGSLQMDLYYGSVEKRIAEAMLETLNESILANGMAYKLAIAIDAKDPECAERARRFVMSRVLVLDEKRARISGFERLFDYLKSAEAVPFSMRLASQAVSFSDRILRVVPVATAKPMPFHGEITIGYFVEDAVSPTGEKITTSKSSFNLGTIITGLPGYGKTRAAMSLVSQLVGNNMPSVIISPTDEWNAFAESHGMRVIKFYNQEIPINFFSCPTGTNVERFYENLAMLMAAASNAGPYKNSLEKCLLSAFQRAYAGSADPDPVSTYDYIEEAIIEQHGKRSNVGVKYTKHGENIKAALENLRLMLSRPEFATKNSANFRELVDNGILFDLSGVSNEMKPFFYALILNQVYAIADSFDSYGEHDLRMLVCIEEAQLAFGEQQSAASSDLKQRIQDFRKRGIALILIAHSVTEIDVGIRRLCQTKLYFRQSSDVVKLAALDIGMEDNAQIMASLRSLGQRRCALSYVSYDRGSRRPSGAVFAEIPEEGIYGSVVASHGTSQPAIPKMIDCNISIGGAESRTGMRVDLHYLGERRASALLSSSGNVIFKGLIEGAQYTLLLRGEKAKDSISLKFSASDHVTLKL